MLEEVEGTHDEMLDRRNARALARVIAARLHPAAHSSMKGRDGRILDIAV